MIDNNIEMTIWDDIVDIECVDNEDVYDLSVDDVHNFFANDLLVHNCGEIVLCPYDSCRLMAINLSSFVQNQFLSTAFFDFERFKEVTIKAQRLMDDLVDLESEAIDRIIEKVKSDPQSKDVKQIEIDLWNKIKDKTLQGRRTGLGITALGDALAMLGLRYGSDASIEVTKNIYMTLALGSHESSIIMASERGAFPIFDYELEKDHSYLLNIISKMPQHLELSLLIFWNI